MNIPNSVHEIDWENWNFTERAVLSFVHTPKEVLLIHKKTGLGKGKINAPGGRIEKGELPVEAAIRETQEEIGITPLSPQFCAELSFIFKDGYSLKADAFISEEYDGTPIETDEAKPFWIDKSQIPFEKMWEDDILWIPHIFYGMVPKGEFIFDGDKMMDYKIKIQSNSAQNILQE